MIRELIRAFVDSQETLSIRYCSSQVRFQWRCEALLGLSKGFEFLDSVLSQFLARRSIAAKAKSSLIDGVASDSAAPARPSPLPYRPSKPRLL